MSDRRLGPAGSPAEMPTILHDPITGRVLTPDDLAQELYRWITELEEDALLLRDVMIRLGRVTARYMDAVDTGALNSDARAEAGRERAGRVYARSIFVEDGVTNLEKAKVDLEHRARMHRDHEHTLRAMISGWQTMLKVMGVVAAP
jgi:hypothetical protein